MVGDDHDQEHKKWQWPWLRTQKGGVHTRKNNEHDQEHKGRQ
jgi:hypothetical protein